VSPRHRLPLGPFALLLALLSGAIWLATEELALPWVVVGDSMEPTLSDGDRLLVDLWSFRHRTPRAGEIVLFSGPEPGERPLLKRVAFAPPESEGGLWLLGDNRARSADSRNFGPVPVGRIRGRVVLRYWPLSRAGPIR